MSETKNLNITEHEALLLDSCLNAVKIIVLNGSSKSEKIKEQAKSDGITIENIQSKIPKFNKAH